MTPSKSSPQIGAAQTGQQQGQSSPGTASTQQGGQHSGAGQMQQAGAPAQPRFTDWASI